MHHLFYIRVALTLLHHFPQGWLWPGLAVASLTCIFIYARIFFNCGPWSTFCDVNLEVATKFPLLLAIITTSWLW